MADTFEATYAINTDGAISQELVEECLPLASIEKLEVEAPRKLVGVTSSIAPSDIIAAFQKHGWDAILRGSGKPNSSAVAILEDFKGETMREGLVDGLARIVQVGEHRTMFDITINGPELPAGEYTVSVNENGDISRGIATTGKEMYTFPETLKCTSTGNGARGHAFWAAPLQAWEVIGRSFVLKQVGGENQTLGGVIARSAGAWENDKQVCACTGKTVWQERVDAKNKNIN